MGRRRRTASSIADGLKNRGVMCLLFESPSGFTIFRFSEVHFHLPNTKKKIWAKFAKAVPTTCTVIRKEFRAFKDKSSAINATGVSEELTGMIRRWLLPEMKLAVGKPEYKTIIESKLEITCVHNEIVMAVMWGIQHLMHKYLPEEKAEVAKEDRIPMSQGLKMLLRRYGFDVKPDMVNEQIIEAAGALFECDSKGQCDSIEKLFSSHLRDARLWLKNTSGFNCDEWSKVKLATALKVIFGPEEEDDFREVLSEDELLKLMDDADRYYGVLSKTLSLRTYKKIRFACRVRNEKKILLESLIKKAKEACEAEQAQAREKDKVHGESEQIPQARVMFANVCRMILPAVSASKPPYVNELPLLKGLKRSWDYAFEPIVLNKSIFCESLSLDETGSRWIARISGAQPSTSKAIVPYKPFPHTVLLNQNINLMGMSTLPPRLTESGEQIEVLGVEASPSGSVGDSKDEAELLSAEHSERNVVNIIVNESSKVPRRNPRLKRDSVIRHSPRLKRIRRSPRLNRD